MTRRRWQRSRARDGVSMLATELGTPRELMDDITPVVPSIEIPKELGNQPADEKPRLVECDLCDNVGDFPPCVSCRAQVCGDPCRCVCCDSEKNDNAARVKLVGPSGTTWDDGTLWRADDRSEQSSQSSPMSLPDLGRELLGVELRWASPASEDSLPGLISQLREDLDRATSKWPINVGEPSGGAGRGRRWMNLKSGRRPEYVDLPCL